MDPFTYLFKACLQVSAPIFNMAGKVFTPSLRATNMNNERGEACMTGSFSDQNFFQAEWGDDLSAI